MITVEAGGIITARNLKIDTDILKVDKLGTISVSDKGLTDGTGQGASNSGGSFGGRGSGGNQGKYL
jgi:hypothetical protein